MNGDCGDWFCRLFVVGALLTSEGISIGGFSGEELAHLPNEIAAAKAKETGILPDPLWIVSGHPARFIPNQW